MKLLMGIDPSQPSQRVLDEIVRRSWPASTSVCILHVIDWRAWPTIPIVTEAVRRSAEVLVGSASTKIRQAKLQVEGKIIEGHPRAAVAEYAKQWGADLVLVGSHGASGLTRFLLGSVAQVTLRGSPCFVEIVRMSLRPLQSHPLR